MGKALKIMGAIISLVCGCVVFIAASDTETVITLAETLKMMFPMVIGFIMVAIGDLFED